MAFGMKVNKPRWRGRPARCPRKRLASAPTRCMAILAITGHGQEKL
jgi:hypothetical protein